MTKIFSIPFGHCFLSLLARHLIDTLSNQDPLCRHHTLVLLPTNRSVLGLKTCFKNLIIEKTNPKPFVVPKIFSIPDFLVQNPLGFEEIWTLPKPLSSFEIFSLIVEWLPQSMASVKKIRLALYLQNLFDQITIAQGHFEHLTLLFSKERLENAPQHVCAAAQHIKIVAEILPHYLRSHNLLTKAQWDIKACQIVQKNLMQKPFEHPMIIAGTTGTVPSTRTLIETILAQPFGTLILPGLPSPCLEGELKERIIQMPTHPLHTLVDLCTTLKITSTDIEELQDDQDDQNDQETRRQQVLDRLFSPPDLLMTEPLLSSSDITLIECDTVSEEARVISLIIRKMLIETKVHIAVVTPSPELTERLRCELLVYGIYPNLSAGIPFSDTPVGCFLKLFLLFLKDPHEENALHLAKHPLSFKNNRFDHLKAWRSFEHQWKSGVAVMQSDVLSNDFLKSLKLALQKRHECKSFFDFCEWVCETSVTLTDQSIFSKADGEAFQNFKDTLRQASFNFSTQFEDAFLNLLELVPSVQSFEGLESRVRILGTLEARLNTAECVICASLNEGDWPKHVEADPYLSNAMRVHIGLPLTKRQQGLSAHDFASSFYAPYLFCTRPQQVQGERMVASRFWTRLKRCLKDPFKQGEVFLKLARLTVESKASPILPPQPCPPINSRPKIFYASHLETLMKNPYAYYARYILNLRQLEGLESETTLIAKGKLVHHLLDTYLKSFETPSLQKLLDFSKPYFFESDSGLFGQQKQLGIRQTFWWNRFQQVAKWWHDQLDSTLCQWRKTEIEGSMMLQTQNASYTLKSRADRMEYVLSDEKQPLLKIIDYKTGQLPTKKSIAQGQSIQLLVEAMIAHAKGFLSFDATRMPISIEYWRLLGGVMAVETLCLTLEPIDREYLLSELADFLDYYYNQEISYLCHPRYDREKFFARLEEWQNHIL